MQSSGPGVDGFGSIPNLDSEYCALNSDNSPKNAASRTDIELNTTAHARNALARARVYGAECKSVLIILRKCDCLFKKVCIVHTLILAAIWILCTTPIIVFYVTSAMVC